MTLRAQRNQLHKVALKVIKTVLERPLANPRGGDIRRDWLRPPPLSAFRHLEPIGFGINDDAPEDEWWLFAPEDCLPDLVWPLYSGLITDMAERTSDDGFAMERSMTITAAQARGVATLYSRYMVRSDHAQMMDGKLQTVAMIEAWIGGRWVEACQKRKWQSELRVPVPRLFHSDTEDRLHTTRNIGFATALALRQRYEWAVSLGLDGSPSVRFATDPTGIRDIFRIRDLPEGRDRREALLNWVSGHWRQLRHDPEIETYVRKHMRGACAFNWRGMGCEILPSQFDVEQRDKLLLDRQAMRIAGTDRREVLRGRDT